MRAAVLHALGKAPRFEEFPEPTPGEGEVSCVCMRPVGILSLQGVEDVKSREKSSVGPR